VFGRESQSGDYIGVMALGPGVVARLPEQGCLFGEVALPNLAAGERVWTVPSTSPWSDLGDLGEYVAANFRWLEAHAGGQAWCSPTARVSPGVALERSIIGAGARVTGTGALREVIVWPGAQVQAPLESSVVLGSGRVVPFAASAEN
jgi:hypothetical protein